MLTAGQQNYKVGIYVRLSCDDWVSGTSFDRPGVHRLIEDAKDGKINLILVKDLSRFGRNYIQVGQFTDYLFPMIGVRFIAVNDGVDTLNNDNDIMPFKNLFNEFQSKETSKKIKAVKQVHAKAGNYLGAYVPFGYRSHPDDKHRLVCTDCGAKLYYCTTNGFEERQNHFICSNYKSNTGTCSIHFIREVVLYSLVLEHIQGVIQYVRQFEQMFVKQVSKKSTEEQKKMLAEKRKMSQKAQESIKEIDRLFKRIYEDNVSGRLSEERYTKLSVDYETEQKDLQDKVFDLQTELAVEEQHAEDTGQFLETIRKYTDIQKLTPTILNEFISKIIIHAPDKSSAKRKQKVEIVYNGVGMLNIPELTDEMLHKNRKTA